MPKPEPEPTLSYADIACHGMRALVRSRSPSLSEPTSLATIVEPMFAPSPLLDLEPHDIPPALQPRREPEISGSDVRGAVGVGLRLRLRLHGRWQHPRVRAVLMLVLVLVVLVVDVAMLLGSPWRGAE